MATAPKKPARKSKAAASVPAQVGPPRFFVHGKRPAWGRAVVEEALDDRTRYAFEDGETRTFLRALDSLTEVDVPPDEGEPLARKLLGLRTKKATPAAKSKPRGKPKLPDLDLHPAASDEDGDD